MSLAEAVAPAPASVDVTALVVLFCVPEVVPVTFTAKVHDAFAASGEPDRVTPFDPATAVMVPAPQSPVNPFGVATTCPAGKLSVNPMPLSERPVFGFDRLKVKVVLPFNGMLAAPNAFVMLGGSFAGGGGGGLEDEPPPHAAFQRTLTARKNKKAGRGATRNARVIGLSFYWS
jgi:hypothetical protein